MIKLRSFIRIDHTLAACCILLSVASVWFYAHSSHVLLYSLLLFSFGALLIAYFIGKKEQLITTLFFFVPLSIGTSALGESEIQLPTEPLIGLIILFVLLSMSGVKALRKDLFANPISSLITFELIWLLTTSITSEMPSVSFKFSFIRICYTAVFYFLMLQWLRKTDRAHYLFIAYAAGMIVPVIKGMIFHATLGFSSQGAYWMPRPFYNDHTVYGACIAFILPMLFIMVGARKIFALSKLQLAAVLALTIFLMLAEFLSFSRAAWLSLAGAAGFSLFLFWKITARQLAALLFGGAIALWFFSGDIIGRLAEKNAVSSKGDLEAHVRSITNLETDASNKERINRWKCAIAMGDERPIFGFGPRTYKFLYGQFQLRENMTSNSTFRGNKGHSHSEYLSWYAESGILGILLHGGLFVFTLVFGTGVVSRCRDKRNRLIAAGALLGFCTYFIHGFFNSFMEEDKMSSLVLSSMAIIVFISEKEKQKTSE